MFGFGKKKEQRETVLNDAALDTALKASLSSNVVTVPNAMGIPAVVTSVRFLADTIAVLPVRLYRTSKSGKSKEVLNDYRLKLLNNETGDLLDAYQWKQALIRDYILQGNGYSYIEWKNNEIAAIYYVDPLNVSYSIGPDPIYKEVIYYIGGRIYPEWQIFRVLRNTVNGANGKGIVDENQIQLATLYHTLKYQNRTMRTGAKKGFLKTTQKLTQQVIDNLKKSWKSLYGNDSDETVVVLNAGLEFQDASQSAVDNQLNQNKTTDAHALYSMFGIVPSVLEGKATAEDMKNTVRFGIQPIVDALQSAFNRFCLLEDEKGTLEFEIDTDGLSAADMTTRFQGYEIALRNGWMQIDEIRNAEGLNPLGLDFIQLNLATVLYDTKKKQFYTPNTNATTNLDGTPSGGGGVPPNNEDAEKDTESDTSDTESDTEDADSDEPSEDDQSGTEKTDNSDEPSEDEKEGEEDDDRSKSKKR